MMEEPANLSSLVRQGAETPDEVKTEAFRLWVENGRSWRRVAELTGIADRTLRNWGATGDWETKRRDQAAAFLPGMTTETAFALKLGAHKAGIRLQQIAWDAEERGIKPDLKEVQALTLIVDRGGHSPISKHGPSDVTLEGSGPPIPDFASMSHDELRAYEERVKKERTRHRTSHPITT